MADRTKRKAGPRRLRGLSMVAFAALFAAQKHRDQLRKDGVTPFVVHPLEVFCVLAQAGIRDPTTLAVALLHDTLEETQTTFEELQGHFGRLVAISVRALTDDHALSRTVRKKLQAVQAASLPRPARLVRLGDKLVNILSFAAGTPRAQRLQYLAAAHRVRTALQGVHRPLEEAFDRAYALRAGVLRGRGMTISDFLLGMLPQRESGRT